MDAKEFRDNLDIINDKLDANCIAVEHRKDKMFIIPISQMVSLNRKGLVHIWNYIKNIQKKGYIFEKF